MSKPDIVERLQEYASDWRIRTGSVEVVTEAIGTIASLRTELQEARALAYAETGAGPRLWKECWQDEVDKNEMLRSSLSLKEITAETRAAAIEECALIVENYAAGRTMTGEALKPRVVPSQTSVLIAAAIRQLKGEQP